MLDFVLLVSFCVKLRRKRREPNKLASVIVCEKTNFRKERDGLVFKEEIHRTGEARKAGLLVDRCQVIFNHLSSPSIIDAGSDSLPCTHHIIRVLCCELHWLVFRALSRGFLCPHTRLAEDLLRRERICADPVKQWGVRRIRRAGKWRRLQRVWVLATESSQAVG